MHVEKNWCALHQSANLSYKVVSGGVVRSQHTFGATLMPPTWFMTHIWPILQTIHLSSKQYTKPIQHIPISPICLYLGSLLSIFWPTLFCNSRHLAVQPHPITPIYPDGLGIHSWNTSNNRLPILWLFLKLACLRLASYLNMYIY